MSKAEGPERSEGSKIKQAVEKEITKEGLPKEAFAIVGDPNNPDKTWKLPHHTKAIFRALQGRLNIEKPVLERSEGTVNWGRIGASGQGLGPSPQSPVPTMPAAVAALSRGGYRGERIQADPEEIIQAARHLASHYEKAGKSIPPTLGVLT